MITFQTTNIALFLLISAVVLFRYFNKGQFYFTSHYIKEKEYEVDEVTLKKRVLEALNNSSFKNIKENESGFKAITFPSLFSFSEVINTNIIKINDFKYIVKINSKCFVPTAVFDWGKNKRNSLKFFKNLDIAF